MTNADDLDFTGRTVLVSGAGTSIGRAVVLEFVARGARVIISDADETAARAVERDARALEARLSDGPVLVVAGDDEELCRRAAELGRVDIVVIAAAPAPRVSFFDAAGAKGDPIEPAQSTVWRLAQAFVPGMMDGGWGRIVVLGESREASVTTRSLAADLGEYGITVNEIDVGQPKMRAAIGRPPRPDEIAFAVACLGSPRSAAITGSVLHVDGGAPR